MTSGELVSLLSMRLCSYREAARTLRVPASTLWWWLEGREDEGYEPVLRTSPTGDNVMTWGEFVEAAYLREYRRRRVPLHRLRLFIEALRDELQLPHPLATQRPFIAAEHGLVLELEERVELAGSSARLSSTRLTASWCSATSRRRFLTRSSSEMAVTCRRCGGSRPGSSRPWWWTPR
jgi:hypothetical protein